MFSNGLDPRTFEGRYSWDDQDDSVLAPDEVWWANQVQTGGGRTEAKAKIRWAED
jgi:hypothetical protein